MKIKIYGCRGTIASAKTSKTRFGNNTSCVVVHDGEQYLVLDAGSGLASFAAENKEAALSANILISHLHLDHIIGLTYFAPAWNPKCTANIYTCDRSGGTLKEQVFGSFKPPYWPVSIGESTYIDCAPIELDKTINIGNFAVTPFLAQHPDLTSSFHIKNGKKSIVYLLDSEQSAMEAKAYAALVEYCRDVDLVIFDAAYTPEDYPKFRSWGHSTVEDAVKLHKDSNCKQILLTHFDPTYSDEKIVGMLEFKGAENFILAKEGMEIEL